MDKIKIVSWICSGFNRKIVFELLEFDKLKVPSQIFREGNLINPKLSIQNVSDILKIFKEKDLIECINENSKQGRLYKLTTLGSKIDKLI